MQLNEDLVTFVSLSDYEKEENFLKYLLGWNNTLASHQKTLLSNPQKVAEDDQSFRKSFFEKWELPFEERISDRPIGQLDPLALRFANMSTQEKQQVDKAGDFVMSFIQQDNKKSKLQFRKQQEEKKKAHERQQQEERQKLEEDKQRRKEEIIAKLEKKPKSKASGKRDNQERGTQPSGDSKIQIRCVENEPDTEEQKPTKKKRDKKACEKLESSYQDLSALV